MILQTNNPQNLSMLNMMTDYYARLFGARDKGPEMEESKLMSDSEEFVSAMKTRRSGLRVDLVLHFLSVSMFITGIVTLLVALSHKQSDQSCAAQLSIWCE